MDANQVKQMHPGYVIRVMSIYGELNPTLEICMLFAFKGKNEHLVRVNAPNKAYPSQHIDINIHTGLINNVIVLNSR